MFRSQLPHQPSSLEKPSLPPPPGPGRPSHAAACIISHIAVIPLVLTSVFP
jgi:hypothetical protein